MREANEPTLTTTEGEGMTVETYGATLYQEVNEEDFMRKVNSQLDNLRFYVNRDFGEHLITRPCQRYGLFFPELLLSQKDESVDVSVVDKWFDVIEVEKDHDLSVFKIYLAHAPIAHNAEEIASTINHTLGPAIENKLISAGLTNYCVLFNLTVIEQ
ncbi:hypothetical protein [Sporosarcina sp. P33]|uniref:hypothetical protein n=1 Tax=Sporosarcina sp. P33 TaxID=1930764 RepID=UPI0009BF792B|nr:hypothetical protein [Sporosarcina sp. P33]ARD48840.1 hypothetical protein SporoP33_11800 [Sporosarcina sp. P33]